MGPSSDSNDDRPSERNCEHREQSQDVQTTEERKRSELEPELNINDLIERYHSLVYRYLFRLAGNRADAEDLSQQTFLIAHQRLHQIRESEKARAWLLTVARSCFLKMGRRKRPVDASTLELDVDRIPREIEEVDWIDPERLQLWLDQLEENQRTILTMFYFEQLSYQEIAAEMNVKIGTVMSRLSRAKSKLRGIVLQQDEEDSLEK